ncbi:MAG TPA: hypothetical protein VFR03_01020 [Thermoanaerobaculia bacterium]|nr:hypothetical protein [Thermoanaerobaculia bacterium]
MTLSEQPADIPQLPFDLRGAQQLKLFSWQELLRRSGSDKDELPSRLSLSSLGQLRQPVRLGLGRRSPELDDQPLVSSARNQIWVKAPEKRRENRIGWLDQHLISLGPILLRDLLDLLPLAGLGIW